MTKLTKKTKLKIWRLIRRDVKEILLKDSESPLKGSGLRDLLTKRYETVIGVVYEGFASEAMERLSPETMKYKPIPDLSKFSYWWPRNTEGYKARLEVCNAIVKELEYKK